MPALVICEWWRSRNKHVVYTCPTDQLARQVAATATEEGIPAVVLTGSHKAWPLEDLTRYDAAEAIVITTYSTVFNSSPKRDPHPDLLVFDDAHNGEQFVAELLREDNRWGEEDVDAEAYDELLDVLSPGLDGVLLQRLRSPNAEIGTHTRTCTW
jgi:hypothetical protein